MYASLVLSCIFSLLFGITKSFSAALLVRFLLGCSNGIMSTIKTVVSEISCNEAVEARIMNLVVGMWGWGFLISPVVSGALAEPVKQYPDAAWLNEGTFAGDVLREYPFLLPNVLGAAVCLIAIVLIRLFVHETHPAEQRHSVTEDLRMLLARCQRYLPGYRYKKLPGTKDSDHDFSMEDELDLDHIYRETVTEKPPSMMSMLSQKDTRNCLFLFWSYSFVSLTVDEAFPLFCLSHTAGFGIPEKEIGKILSCTGLIFAVCQYFVYTVVYNYCGGLRGSIKAGSALSAPIMFLVPLSLLLNRGEENLRWSTFFFLAVVLACHRCFALVFFSSISVATNRTVPSSRRGTMNGLSMLGGSVAKALGPAFAGLLTTLSASWLGRYASLLIFGTIGILGICVTWNTFVFLPKVATSTDDKNEEREGIVQNIELKEQPISRAL
jgi:Major Facilitator Superfamily